MNVVPLFLRKHFTLRVSCIFLVLNGCKVSISLKKVIFWSTFQCFLSLCYFYKYFLSAPPHLLPFLIFSCLFQGSQVFSTASRQYYQLILKHTHLWQQQELTSCSTTGNRFLCSINFKRKSEHKQLIEKFTFPIKWKVNGHNIRRKHAEDKKQFTGFWLLLLIQPDPLQQSN